MFQSLHGIRDLPRAGAPIVTAEIGGTPALQVRVSWRGAEHETLLKAEWLNPSGSVKDRTAAGLIAALERDGLEPGTTVVESTSGNLGIALARRLSERGCRLIAVIDPKATEPAREAMAAAGAELVLVTEPDGRGGYLLTRLRTVARLCEANPGYRWTDQYRNPANPRVHELTTGPEIAAQGGPELDAVYAAVSTGGTLAGISACLRRLGRQVRIVAVDVESSYAIRMTRPGDRLVPGIGASRRAGFLGPGAYDVAVSVADVAAFAMCRMFLEDTGIWLGGSSGCVLAAYARDLDGPGAPVRPVLVCPDAGTKYAGTFYDDGWLRRSKALGRVERAIGRLRTRGLGFTI